MRASMAVVSPAPVSISRIADPGRETGTKSMGMGEKTKWPRHDGATQGGAVQREATGWHVTAAGQWRRRTRRAGWVLAVALLAACSSHSRRDAAAMVIYSPLGEPLSGGPLGHPACKDAVSHWLDRTDTNHDGFISLDEYLADARRQFRVMDLDGTGELTASELAQYRAPYGIDPKGKKHPGESSLAADDRPDPVMAADDKMRFEVTLGQFLSYQTRVFAALDPNRTRSVPRAAFLAPCGG
jgi:hypothetical protein